MDKLTRPTSDMHKINKQLNDIQREIKVLKYLKDNWFCAENTLCFRGEMEDEHRVYIFFDYDGEKNIWRYELSNQVDKISESKFKVEPVYREKTKKRMSTILKSLNIHEFSTIFEIKISNNLPLENALIPIFKRKILSYIIQSNTIGFLKKP